jgi:surfeit locus 1 family protein
MQFRPLPLFTLAAAAMLAVLLTLGFWQLHRLQWKLDLIAQVNRNLTLPPVSLDTALAMGKGAEYRRVALGGRFDHGKEAYLRGLVDGTPVWHVITPLVTDDGRTLLVDRGIVPDGLRDPAKRRAGQIDGERRIIGVWRTPDPPGFFTPPPDFAHRLWYSRDVTSIAAADRIAPAAPVIVEADAAPNPGGWPKGGQTQVTFRNEHLQYAITWFGLAATLLGVYLAFHISKGRLGWKKKAADKVSITARCGPNKDI